jgi:hypothetical protein
MCDGRRGQLPSMHLCELGGGGLVQSAEQLWSSPKPARRRRRIALLAASAVAVLAAAGAGIGWLTHRHHNDGPARRH